MALVDYSDSDSDEESTAAAAATAKPASTDASSSATTSKKASAFKKVVERGKIVVSLPQTSSSSRPTGEGDSAGDEPPAKRARTAGAGGAFSGFNSLLPPPKKAAALSAATKSSPGGGGVLSKLAGSTPRAGFSLKTGAAPAFSRSTRTEGEDDDAGVGGGATDGLGLSLPPPKPSAAGPTIPPEQVPADQVTLVGRPTMFMPLSVARRPGPAGKRKATLAGGGATGRSPGGAAAAVEAKDGTKVGRSKGAAGVGGEPETTAPATSKKVSLFSIPADDEDEDEVPTSSSVGPSSYESLVDASDLGGREADDEDLDAIASAARRQPASQPQPQAGGGTTLSQLADSMKLSASERRAMFGRRGGDAALLSRSTAAMAEVDLAAEYRANEAARRADEAAGARGEPVAALKAIKDGKHSLKQLVNAVTSQKEALEENFAKNRSSQRAAAGRYGWR